MGNYFKATIAETQIQVARPMRYLFLLLALFSLSYVRTGAGTELKDCSTLLLMDQTHPLVLPAAVRGYDWSEAPLILLSKDVEFPKARISWPAQLLEALKSEYGPKWQTVASDLGTFFLSENDEKALIFVPQSPLKDNGQFLAGMIQSADDLRRLFVVVTNAKASAGSVEISQEVSGKPSGNLAVRSVHRSLAEYVVLPKLQAVLEARRCVECEEHLITDRVLNQVVADLNNTAKETEAYSESLVWRRIGGALGREIDRLSLTARETDRLEHIMAYNELGRGVPALKAFVSSVYQYTTVSWGLGFQKGSITDYIRATTGVPDVTMIAHSLKPQISRRVHWFAHLQKALSALENMDLWDPEKQSLSRNPEKLQAAKNSLAAVVAELPSGGLRDSAQSLISNNESRLGSSRLLHDLRAIFAQPYSRAVEDSR